MEIVVCKCGQKTQVPAELGNRTMHCSRCSRQLIAAGQSDPDAASQPKAGKQKGASQNTRENYPGQSHWNSRETEERPASSGWNMPVVLMIAVLLVGIAATAYVMSKPGEDDDEGEVQAGEDSGGEYELLDEKAEMLAARRQKIETAVKSRIKEKEAEGKGQSVDTDQDKSSQDDTGEEPKGSDEAVEKTDVVGVAELHPGDGVFEISNGRFCLTPENKPVLLVDYQINDPDYDPSKQLRLNHTISVAGRTIRPKSQVDSDLIEDSGVLRCYDLVGVVDKKPATMNVYLKGEKFRSNTLTIDTPTSLKELPPDPGYAELESIAKDLSCEILSAVMVESSTFLIRYAFNKEPPAGVEYYLVVERPVNNGGKQGERYYCSQLNQKGTLETNFLDGGEEVEPDRLKVYIELRVPGSSIAGIRISNEITPEYSE